VSELDTAPRVIIVGNLTIDDVVLPDGRTRMGSVGGNAVYAALAARLWARKVGVVTRRGDDFPSAHIDQLCALGIDTLGITDIAGPTVRNWVLYEEDGSRKWIYRTPEERSAQVAVRAADLPVCWLSDSVPPVVHVAGMPLPAAAALVARVRAFSPLATITLDTHEDWVLGHEQELLALARRVDVFVPSRDELADLVGYDEPERGARQLLANGVPAVVVKLAAQGAIVLSHDGVFARVDACKVEALDSTGAGDAFCGGLAAGLAMGDSLLRAVRRGCVSASFAVETFGSMSLGNVDPNAAASRLEGAKSGHSGEASATGIGEAVDEGSYGISVMRDEIEMIPQVIADNVGDLQNSVARIARLLVEHRIEHLFITGCGDSSFAGQASSLTFLKHAGVAAEGVHALDLARYRARYLPQRSAVLGVSFSGKVGRTTEALVQARRFGHLTIALTNNIEGRLAAVAEHMLPIDVPTLGFSPGTSTYLAMVATLMDLALRWGSALKKDTSVARTALETIGKLSHETLEANAGPAREAAELLLGQPWVTFLGAGPNEASARFGAAKLFEGPQILGVSTNIEEWAHEEYFVTRPGTPVVVVAPSGAGYGRAAEILSEINFIGALPIVVSDLVPDYPCSLLPLPTGVPEEFSPLLAALPLSLLGFHLAEMLGKGSYNFPSERIRAEHYETIHRATIGEPA